MLKVFGVRSLTPNRILYGLRKWRVLRKFDQGVYELEAISSCLCGGQSFQPVADTDRYGLPVGVKLCMRCGLGVQSPRLTENMLELFYQSDYRRLLLGTNRIGHKDFERGYRRGRRILTFLSQHGLVFEGQTVAEVGCGSGGILKCFQDHGNRVWGCELDKQCLAFSRSMGISTLEGSVEVLVEVGVKADLVVLSHLVEHLPRPLEFLATLHGVLADGTIIYVEVPGLKNPSIDFFYQIQVAHLYYYDLKTLQWLMQKAGFTLIAGDESVQSIFHVGKVLTTVPLEGNFERNLAIIRKWAEQRSAQVAGE